MTNQIRRAGISITSNLAEGTSRNSYKEKIRFVEISYSSLMEVLNCLIISNDLGWMPLEEFDIYRRDIDLIANKLSALRNTFTTKLN